MSIGLKVGTVAVESHKMEWEISASKIIKEIKNILQEDMVDAQHIGSTSIKSICAKPIIDIVVGVNSFEQIMKHNDKLLEKGIRYRREDYPGQHLYICADSENTVQTHYIHVVIWGGENWNNYINMRDYLNAHEEKAKEYSELKEVLAQKYPEDRIAYTNGKSALIEELLQNAKAWRMQIEASEIKYEQNMHKERANVVKK